MSFLNWLKDKTLYYETWENIDGFVRWQGYNAAGILYGLRTCEVLKNPYLSPGIDEYVTGMTLRKIPEHLLAKYLDLLNNSKNKLEKRQFGGWLCNFLFNESFNKNMLDEVISVYHKQLEENKSDWTFLTIIADILEDYGLEDLARDNRYYYERYKA